MMTNSFITVSVLWAEKETLLKNIPAFIGVNHATDQSKQAVEGNEELQTLSLV